ncbi:GatB/YqeY domain-containing protein [Nannocystis sp. ILAH1]|uniref:GatB/YqeY domain-containing protein n=1 Tax=unclassified Nannocystis TaxID=2627009 RepID=UPI00226FF8C7|nr:MULTISPECIES: GatB/YqeY domain-containing protein [unclassified Nannocystis]MCY0990335.1 GatB/YqeY domain-containing protein [Nannocystis sp. ILAH1]MCY1069376.1 GatB/YqeY domain-containing protein [Nannocystis sp. RBIL2]
MSVKDQIEAKLREARLARDEATKNVIGMLKSKVLLELKSGSGAEDNDALWLDTIKSYVKQLKKTIGEYEKLGDRGQQLLSESQFELRFCEQFMPTRLDEAATEALVREAATANNITDPKQVGKLVGAVMKTHKDQVDSDLLKQVATRVLAGG